MLRSFRMGNHRSFRDEQELLLLPAYNDDRAALPVIAVYGANASGKSNLLNGLIFMRQAVLESFQRWEVDQGVPRRPFRLAPTSGDQTSSFVVELIAEGVRYTYGFTVDDHRVVEEWLYSYPAKKKRVIFERDPEGFKFGSTVSEHRFKFEVLEELTRPNSLFLSVAAQSNVEPVLPVYRWFRVSLGGFK